MRSKKIKYKMYYKIKKFRWFCKNQYIKIKFQIKINESC